PPYQSRPANPRTRVCPVNAVALGISVLHRTVTTDTAKAAAADGCFSTIHFHVSLPRRMRARTRAVVGVRMIATDFVLTNATADSRVRGYGRWLICGGAVA